MHFLCKWKRLPVIHFNLTQLSKLVDDIAYEVDCQLVNVKQGADIDIGQSYMYHIRFGTDITFQAQTLPRRNKRRR